MSGNEIITIQLGPFANYVGAHLWNLDYNFTFNASSSKKNVENPNNKNEDDENDELRTNRSILFRSVRTDQSTYSKSSKTSVKYVPRAIFCDHNGAVPSKPLSVLVSKEQSRMKQNNQYNQNDYDFFQSSWGGKWGTTVEPTPEPESEEPFLNASWHSLLHSSLQPLSNSPRSLCLLPGSQSLDSHCDLFSQANSMSSVSTEDGNYLESVMEAIRYQTEDCDYIQGFRILVDNDNAWAGFAVKVVERLHDEYFKTPVFVFSCSSPTDAFASTPSSPYSYLWSMSESSPGCPPSLVTSSGENIPYRTKSKSGEPLDLMFGNCVRFVSQNSLINTHISKSMNLALLTAKLSEFDSVFHIPMSLPAQTDLLNLLASVQFAHSNLTSQSTKTQSKTQVKNEDKKDGKQAAEALAAGLINTSNPSTSFVKLLEAYNHSFPFAQHALLTSSVLSLAVHSLLSPIYLGHDVDDISLGHLLAYIRPRSSLCVGSMALTRVKTTEDAVFDIRTHANTDVDRRNRADYNSLSHSKVSYHRDSYDDLEDTSPPFETLKLHHKSSLNIISPLFETTKSQIKSLQPQSHQVLYDFTQYDGSFNFSPIVDTEDPSNSTLTKLTSFTVMQGSSILSKSSDPASMYDKQQDPEYLFRTRFSHPHLDRAQLPRHGICVPHPLPAILPQYLPLPSLFLTNSPSTTTTVAHNSIGFSRSDVEACVISEVFTSRAMSNGFEALRARLKQATKTPSILHSLAHDDWAADDLLESADVLANLADEYDLEV